MKTIITSLKQTLSKVYYGYNWTFLIVWTIILVTGFTLWYEIIKLIKSYL